MTNLNQKGFAPLIIIAIVVAILAIGGYFVLKTKVVVAPTQSPTVSGSSSETAGWKTYTNTKYGVEFKYPQSATIENGEKFPKPIDGTESSVYVGGLIDIQMVNALGKCSDLRTVPAIVSCLGPVSWAQQDQWIPVTIGGLPGVRREITIKPTPIAGSDIAPVGYIYYVNNGKTGFQISFADSIVRRPLMEQVLSTFRFITNPKSTPTPTSISKKSGIKGNVIRESCGGAYLVSPPPDWQPCREQPLALFLLKIRNDISGVEKQVATDSAGKFQIELLPGKYTITGLTNPYGDQSFTVEVKSGIFTETQIKFNEYLP